DDESDPPGSRDHPGYQLIVALERRRDRPSRTRHAAQGSRSPPAVADAPALASLPAARMARVPWPRWQPEPGPARRAALAACRSVPRRARATVGAVSAEVRSMRPGPAALARN